MGGAGRCKHAAALLLTWLYKPEAFQEIEDPETSLLRRSQSELVALIFKMIDRYPDLEVLLELPSPGGPEASTALDPDLIHRQVNVAFSRAGDGWRSGARASSELLDVVSLGEEYVEHKDWRNAAVVYETVARDVLENYEMVHDDEGELLYVVDECIRGLTLCLDASDDPTQREDLLQALFHVYRWNVDAGGYGIGDDVPDRILELASLEERRGVAEWVHSALPSEDSWSDDYAEAANYLLRVRAVYEQKGEEKVWHTLIANLREKNRRLPAMQDEFNQAGL